MRVENRIQSEREKRRATKVRTELQKKKKKVEQKRPQKKEISQGSGEPKKSRS